MYLAHFKLAESPFSITPDPRFVYLTARHREALAHLVYGLDEGGGFVQLTGEIGTGKTTVCRTLLRQLPGHVDAALIFNPQLTVLDLLESICTELGIESPPQDRTAKVLVNRLYAHLLDANARGRRTVLIIDEAQNLSTEVLEEVRLLTNLETDDTKLLQVFLIGQPELRDKLARKELRQLWQRVTARYHLSALTPAETRRYVQHRLSVAGCERELFTRSALRKVHQLTEGIPRRINILCDRALLGAYSSDAERVDAGIVARAGREIAGGTPTTGLRLARKVAVAAVVAAVVGLALHTDGLRVVEWIDRASAALGAGAEVRVDATLASRGPQQPTPPSAEPEPPAALQAADASGLPSTIGAPGDAAPEFAESVSQEPDGHIASGSPMPDSDRSLRPEPVTVLEAAIGDAVLEHEPSSITYASRPAAASPSTSPPTPTRAAEDEASIEEIVTTIDGDGWLRAVLALSRVWRLPPPSAGVSLCDWAAVHGLACFSTRLSWTELRAFDLPAVLELRHGRDAAVHALLSGLAESSATLLVNDVARTITRSDLEKAWAGTQVLLWRPPVSSEPAIKLGQSGSRVSWLRDTLALVDGGEPASGRNDRFDGTLLNRVKAFQRDRGLEADGIVGPRTFIHLSKANSSTDSPSLGIGSDREGSPEDIHPVAIQVR